MVVRFAHALGLGSAYGREFLPIIDRVDKVTILEASEQLRSSQIGGIVPKYAVPAPDGRTGFDSGSFELAVLALGVLHRIPNVSSVIAEIGRITAQDGYLLLREPIISMGDWKGPRKEGVTPREREFLMGFSRLRLEEAGFAIERVSRVTFPLTDRIGHFTRRTASNSPVLVRLGAVLCRLTFFNYRYHTVSAWQNSAPPRSTSSHDGVSDCPVRQGDRR